MRPNGDASGIARSLAWLGLGAVAQTAATIGHFVHGAHVYDDPSRTHVVVPALVALAAVLAVVSLVWWRPTAIARWILIVTAGLPFVGVFGLFHGGHGHVLKLVSFAFGASPERLLEWFDSPDFAYPNDLAFEASGVLTFVIGLWIGWMLVRLARAPRVA